MEKSEEEAAIYSFTPQRVVSKKIEKKYGKDVRESSASRAARLYNTWAARNEKLATERRKQDSELTQKHNKDQGLISDKLKQSKRYANIGHSDKLYEVDPEAKRDRMWKLE